MRDVMNTGRATQLVSRREFLGHTMAISAGILAGSLPAGNISDARADTPSNHNSWQIGCWTRPWMNFDYHVALDAIAEAGMKYVGVINALRPGARQGGWLPEDMIVSYRDPLDKAVRVGEEVKRRGLKVAFFYGGLMGAKNRESAVADFRHVIDLCAAMRCENVLMGGLAETRGQEYDTWLGAVAECCDYSAAKNVQMMIKPHGGVGATGPQLREAIEKVKHKNFTVLYDAGNILYYSDGQVDPVADAATLRGLVTGWCIKDYAPPHAENATSGKIKGNVDVTPGTGQVDFRAVFAALKKGGFTSGPLMIETLTPGDLPHLLAEAKKTRRFVEALIGSC